MAHTKGLGSSRNGRDSPGQRRGVKMFDGQVCHTGNVIVRQCGTHIHPGKNVGRGRDDTLYALCDGTIKFTNGARHTVSVIPLPVEEEAEEEAEPVEEAEVATEA